MTVRVAEGSSLRFVFCLTNTLLSSLYIIIISFLLGLENAPSLVLTHACCGETGVGGCLKGSSNSCRGQQEVCCLAGEEHKLVVERIHGKHTVTQLSPLCR